MTREEFRIIEVAVQIHINDLKHCGEIRDAQGNEESRVFFLEEAIALERAMQKLKEEMETNLT